MSIITEFIAKLNSFQKKLLSITLVIVVVALFDRLLIDPTMTKLSVIDGEIAKEEAAIKQDLHFLSYQDRILKESQAFDAYVTEQLSTDEEMIAAFLKKIEGLAKQSNVILIKVTPASGQQEKRFLKYQAELECSGKLADIVSFMHLVNVSTDLLKVIKFNFGAKKADTEDIKATMTITKIVVTARPPLLNTKEALRDHSTPLEAAALSVAL